MEVCFGIDFGTTNSACVGIIRGQTALNIGDEFDGRPFPSIVVIDPKTGQIWTGREAWQQRSQFKKDCIVIPSVKSNLGSKRTWDVAGQLWTPAMIAAEVLRGLKQKVEAKSGSMKLTEAVIAVPVRFTQSQRADLRQAARFAGIKIKSIVSEPTAAFFRHYSDIKGFPRIGVFDWGGGTLDIAILENHSVDNHGGDVREVAVDGLQLGGDNIDKKLALWVHDQVLQQKNGNIRFKDMPAADKDNLLVECERAKINLGSLERVDISLFSYGKFGAINVRIDYKMFSQLIEAEVNRAIVTFENLLREYNISIEELGAILMVGGSVNLGPFMEAVEKRWPHANIICPDDSDWSVARGAALLSMQEGEYVLADDIGVILSNDKFYPILKKDTPINEAKSKISFALVEESNTAHFIFAYPDGDIIGYMNVPAMGFFKEKINLLSEVGEDMVLEVKAQSENRSERYLEYWNYPGPRIFYHLPLGLEVEIGD